MVTSTMKPLESQCNKDDVFVSTFHAARNYTDQWANLNFIIQMRKAEDVSSVKNKVEHSTVIRTHNNNIHEAMVS